MVKKARTGTSYASKRDDLPGGVFAALSNAPRLWRSFVAANKTPANENARGSKMVADEAPYPHPRPSLELAAGADAAAFKARWQQERRRAKTHSTNLKRHGVPTMSDDYEEKSRPTESLREGPLKAAIWRNEGQNGDYHTVTLARSYKDKEGNWQDTGTFRAKDMLSLSELARRTHHEMQDRDREIFKEQRRSAPSQQRSRDEDHRH